MPMVSLAFTSSCVQCRSQGLCLMMAHIICPLVAQNAGSKSWTMVTGDTEAVGWEDLDSGNETSSGRESPVQEIPLDELVQVNLHRP